LQLILQAIMSNETPLVQGSYLLEKFPGKGGWTYARVPEIAQGDGPFGWVTVKGSVDHYELKQYKLMPMGDGTLFLPVKAAVRKLIKKQAGDYVQIVLYADEIRIEIPEEIMDCFELEPSATLEQFKAFTPSQQKAYLDWIYQAKSEETKANRILMMMTKVGKNLKLHESS